jgi:hypothetical protein
MIQNCRHIMPSGLRCKSPAMRGSAFCYFHARAQRPARPGRAPEARIEIPAVLDNAGILQAVHQILQALGSGNISSRRAGILLHGIRLAAALPPAGPQPTRLSDLSHMIDNLPAPLDAEFEALMNKIAAQMQ